MREWRNTRSQVLFERLLVHDNRIEEAEVAEPFATLADPDLPRQLAGTATAASSCGGSNEALIIGKVRCEPATGLRCRQAPIVADLCARYPRLRRTYSLRSSVWGAPGSTTSLGSQQRSAYQPRSGRSFMRWLRSEMSLSTYL